MDDADLELLDPHPDICALFCYYDRLYFQGRLGACTVSWSGPRMTQCAGTCSYNAGGLCQIRLSGPLLQFRPVPDLKDTLLHEMIHAFLFLTDGNRDHDDHGPAFRNMMQEINASTLEDQERPVRGYSIGVFHSFHDEVALHRVHHWT